MILLADIGNTHLHLALAGPRRIQRHRDWPHPLDPSAILEWLAGVCPERSVLCSVVPDRTGTFQAWLEATFHHRACELRCNNLAGVGIDYPRPESIGPDRLANAIAARRLYGAPSIVVDFGTAVTLDVVNPEGNYVGGVIAPGLNALTNYLHEKTALLPRVEIREPAGWIGKNTEEAMLTGAVHGYRGLIRELISGVRTELAAPEAPVIATGGYAALIASGLPLIEVVHPLLTLEGLREFDRLLHGPPAPAPPLPPAE